MVAQECLLLFNLAAVYSTAAPFCESLTVIIQPRHFIRFMDGRAGSEIVIGFVPGALTARLLTLQTDLRLRRDYAIKLARRKLDYCGFGQIQSTIDYGWCTHEDDHHLAFLWIQERTHPIVWFLLIKTDAKRRELWLVTFHRIKLKQLSKRVVDATRIVRDHVEEFDG